VDEQIQCRYDWYQTATTVIVSVYAKKVNNNETKIEISEHNLKIHVKFEDGKVFKKDIYLPEPVKASTSNYEILSAKIEIKLIKGNGSQWKQDDLK